MALLQLYPYPFVKQYRYASLITWIQIVSLDLAQHFLDISRFNTISPFGHTHNQTFPAFSVINPACKNTYCLGTVFFVKKYACIFFWGGDSTLFGFSTEIIFRGEKSFQRELFWGIFTLGEIARIPIRNSSYVLLSHCLLDFTHGDVKGNCPG